ncbi:hypothetical protein POX_e07325 [Penicillium oxalicum]|uniref:hypothetical protein n=1 Tax=Penicillium oxalicum TaxID=69781 RepID=UPI0020B645DE|nr:hypothetical protein POX_e07325 [Penicillium oxalicum]KAI2789295.1 hypothetical protein POX_e07325 [Penicillium oxalicum]
MMTSTTSAPLRPHGSPDLQHEALADVTPPLQPEEQAARIIQTIDFPRQPRAENAAHSEASSDEDLEDMVVDESGEDPEDRDGTNSVARKNWQRAVNVAIQATGNRDSPVERIANDMPGRPGPGASVCPPKMMGLEYFLEMVDSKHRHGSNLRAYHAAWKESPSKENFFHWLDYGAGKDVELPQCSRQQLEKDQVRYLTSSERFNYLVKIDDAGLLRWAKNDELVETDSKRFKDTLHGVVRIADCAPNDLEEPGQATENSAASAPASADVPLSSVVTSNKETKNPNVSTKEDYELDKAVKNFSRIRPAVVYDHFAGGLSVKNGMWIFVADTSFRMYIGIKEQGVFQHSSFLRGGRISAAGLIKTKNGQIRGFAPLSGHYRPHLSNFRAFHHSLQERGADLSRVSMTKSYAILAGVEGWTSTKRKAKSAKCKLDGAKHKLHMTRSRADDAEDGEYR